MPASAGLAVFALAFGLYFSVHLVSRRSDAALRAFSLEIELGVERLLSARLNEYGHPGAEALDTGYVERMTRTVARFVAIARPLRLTGEAAALQEAWSAWLGSGAAGNRDASADSAFLASLYAVRDALGSHASGISSSFDLVMILLALTLSLGSAGAVAYWSAARAQSLRRELAESGFRLALAAEDRVRVGIAMELHDDVAQDLVAARMQCERAAADAGGRDSLPAQAAITLSAASAKIRAICSELRPPDLLDLGLPAALVSLCDEISKRSGLPIERTIPEELPRLPSATELALWRIVRESLSNATKHSRGDVRVEARLERTRQGRRIVLETTDGGHVPDRHDGGSGRATGYGLGVMRERARAAGLDLAIEIDPASTRVRIEVPVMADAAVKQEQDA
ncbi:MAG: hypothetical protein JXA15_03265 [Spirochaetales bacterium]|nr:hypothetical protein [Spirochaetales bacterium]